jgi:3-phenylpropionate/trans-cinnamate dioxygenase ferredoxin reductase component
MAARYRRFGSDRLRTMDVDVLLIGGGIASATAAATLRVEGFDGSILLAGRELDPPYHRPPLSKGLLLGTQSKDDLLIEVPDATDLRTRTNVLALDTEARAATLQGGEEVRYGVALVATGAMVRRLPLAGTDLDGLHYLRAPGNARSIREDADAAEQVVCVGGSYVGCEVAASLTVLGKRVTIVMQEDEPMERGFGRTVGRWVRELLEAKGIEILGRAEVARFAGDGRVASVVLKDGRELLAQLVVCGTGAIPDVMLARKSGLAVGDTGGVRCDDRLRTSADGVWAAGDMCEYTSVLHDGAQVRIEHEALAAAQGAHVARAIATGSDEPFAEVPWFWSDLADWVTIEHFGAAQRPDAEELDGDPATGRFSVRHLQQGRLVGVTSVGGHARRSVVRRDLRPA